MIRTPTRPGALTLAFVLAVAACSGDSPTATDQTNSEDTDTEESGTTFQAVIEGEAWSTTTVNIISEEPLSLLAFDSAELGIIVGINEHRTGTHTVADGTAAFVYSRRGAGYDYQAQKQADGTTLGSGSLTVTELTDDRVSGTFEFRAVQYDGDPSTEDDEVTVTDGEFSVALR